MPRREGGGSVDSHKLQFRLHALQSHIQLIRKIRISFVEIAIQISAKFCEFTLLATWHRFANGCPMFHRVTFIWSKFTLSKFILSKNFWSKCSFSRKKNLRENVKKMLSAVLKASPIDLIFL